MVDVQLIKTDRVLIVLAVKDSMVHYVKIVSFGKHNSTKWPNPLNLDLVNSYQIYSFSTLCFLFTSYMAVLKLTLWLFFNPLEIRICKQRPCFGSASCLDVKMPPYFLCLQCPPGKTGYRCDVGNYRIWNAYFISWFFFFVPCTG